MLKVENLIVKAGNQTILDNLNLTVLDDEIHVIMGPNGTGKSTLCKAIMKHPDYKITNGKIIYNDEEIQKLSSSEIAKKGIFLLMQNPTEIPGVSNAELLRAVLLDRGENESIFAFTKRLNDAVKKVGLDSSFIHRSVNESMSGGEKKKNELLQLYILNPRLILLDELDSGLDVDSLKTLCEALMEYKRETKCSIIIITHHSNILKYLDVNKVHILENKCFSIEGDASLVDKIESQGFRAFNMSGEGVYE